MLAAHVEAQEREARRDLQVAHEPRPVVLSDAARTDHATVKHGEAVDNVAVARGHRPGREAARADAPWRGRTGERRRQVE